MAELKNKVRFFVVAGVALFAVLIFYSLNLRHKERANAFERGVLTISAPIHRGASAINNFIASVWTDYLYLVDLRRENQKLLEVAKKLNTRLIASEEEVHSNERLKKLLSLKESLKAPSVVASVIGEDSSPWFESI